jgi:PHD/YefM family antitoxin component YafN of YafNO toxin-antitoxin module
MKGVKMTVHTYSSREFTRDVGAAKRAAAQGPVVITDRGKPAFALLKIQDYYALTGKQQISLLEMMDAIPGGEDIDFEPQKARVELHIPDLG